MLGIFGKAALLALALSLALAAAAQAQSRRPQPGGSDRPSPAPAVLVDRRDSVVVLPGAHNGRPYWLALAQCGGVYFQLNLFYADMAAHARVVRPDPKAVAEYTDKLKEAIKAATAFFDGAEHFLMADRGVERDDAVLIYDPQARAVGERYKTVPAALAAVQACPALYQACQAAYPKACSEPLPPIS
jgi:hypothetical protein